MHALWCSVFFFARNFTYVYVIIYFLAVVGLSRLKRNRIHTLKGQIDFEQLLLVLRELVFIYPNNWFYYYYYSFFVAIKIYHLALLLISFQFSFVFDKVILIKCINLSNLSHAGIFPGRCYPIPAREITQEELMMVIDTYFMYFLIGDPQTNVGQWLDILANDIYCSLFSRQNWLFYLFNLNMIWSMDHTLLLLNTMYHRFSISCKSSSSSKISIE